MARRYMSRDDYGYRGDTYSRSSRSHWDSYPEEEIYSQRSRPRSRNVVREVMEYPDRMIVDRTRSRPTTRSHYRDYSPQEYIMKDTYPRQRGRSYDALFDDRKHYDYEPEHFDYKVNPSQRFMGVERHRLELTPKGNPMFIDGEKRDKYKVVSSVVREVSPGRKRRNVDHRRMVVERDVPPPRHRVYREPEAPTIRYRHLSPPPTTRYLYPEGY